MVRPPAVAGSVYPADPIELKRMDASFFETPLGQVSIDSESVEQILALSQVHLLDKAHTVEHSLEVQLPFLQVALPKGLLLAPMVVGDADIHEVAEILDVLWGGRKHCWSLTSSVVICDLANRR